MKQLQEILVREREKRNLNQSQMAKRLGISSQLLGQYESGRQAPKTKFFIKWKEVFGGDLMKQIETNVSHETQIKAVSELEPLADLTASNRTLADANKALADAHKLIAEAHSELITMLKISLGKPESVVQGSRLPEGGTVAAAEELRRTGRTGNYEIPKRVEQPDSSGKKGK